MQLVFNRPWVEAQVDEAVAIWSGCAGRPVPDGERFSPEEHRKREDAYDQGLGAVERELRRSSRTKVERQEMQERIVASFARFSAAALDLSADAVELLTHGFLPVGIQFSRAAKRFDGALGTAEIVQACRNAWTACGLQPLLGVRMKVTPAIVGYSLLYPYSDNYLDDERVGKEEKLAFSRRFRLRLRGEGPAARNGREAAVWALVKMVEAEFPRREFPQVFDAMVAIHDAQVESLAQGKGSGWASDAEVLRISCAKGGTSVLADACLVRGWLNEEESRCAFEWGALLQLGDDLQDVREDLKLGSETLFTRAARAGEPLDGLGRQLLNLSERVADRMDGLPGGDATLKDLLRMSWRSLILMAVAGLPEFFSASFLKELESGSAFRFGFLRARQRRLTGQRGLYAKLFDVLLEEPGRHGAGFAQQQERLPDLAALWTGAERAYQRPQARLM